MPLKHIEVILLLAAVMAAGFEAQASRWQESQTKANGRGATMPSSQAPDLAFTASLRLSGQPLVSEQAADFDLQIRNRSGALVNVLSLDNSFTPTFSIQDAAGRSLGEYSPGDYELRVLGEIGITAPSTPSMVTLANGGAHDTWLNVWGYRDPLPPGKYSFEARHQTQRIGPRILSNRVGFEIVPAHVEALALGYDGPSRANSELAWLAIPQGSQQARLLIRQSGFTGHRSVQLGGTPNGEFPPGSRIALGAMPMDAKFPPAGWVAVVAGSTLHLIQHNMSTPHWRPAPVTLPVSDVVPIQRFPNRGYAVFLGAGKDSRGPVLTGLVMRNGGAPPKPWTVRLSRQPVHAACAFTMEGPIAVLYASDDGKAVRLHRIDINEDGTVTTPERDLGETPNEVLGMVADMRVGQPAAFVLLEADRQAHNRVGWVKVPLVGELVSTGLRPVAGWPMTPGVQTKPERPAQIAVEVGPGGMPWLAMVNDRGDLIGGMANGGLTVFEEGKKQVCRLPQIAALVDSLTVSCFDVDGMLIHSGPGAANH